MTLKEKIARMLCERNGYDPDSLEPGTVFGIDATLANGDSAYYMWRTWEPVAEGIVKLVNSHIQEGIQ